MEFLSALDLFGIQPGLTIDNLGKFKSVQGFIITIIAISITLLAALSPLNNWIYRLNPLIVQETKLNTGSSFIGGNKNPIYFGIRCLDVSKMKDFDNLGGMNTIEKRVPQPKITQIIVKNGQLNKSINISLDKCDSKNDDYLLGHNIIHNLYCLTDKIELYDKNNGAESSRLLIQYERENFKDILYGNPLANCGISIIYQNTYLDASNYENYIQFDISSEELMTKPAPELLFQTLTFKKQTYKKKLPVFSSSSYDERVYSTLDRSYTRASLNPPLLIANSVPIMLLSFEFSKKEDIFNLKSFEFQDLLSTIGGTFGLIISLLRVFAAELNKIPMKAKIMNSIFKFYKVENDVKDSKNKLEKQIKDISEQLPDLIKRKSTLKEVITSKSKIKFPDDISIYDLYRLKFNSICKRKLTHREEFIKLMEEFVINSSNIENMSKLSYIVTQLAHLLIGPSFAKYIGPPELNLRKQKLDFFTFNKEIIFSNEADYQEIGNLDKLLEDQTLSENIKNYIMKKYEESNS